jgi:hybrid cluster-associated redox disulfide protein
VNQPKVDELLNVPIEVILGRWPEASQVFIGHRMGCIGCAFSRFHTPQDAIEIYQLDKGSFLRFLGDLMHPTDEQDT